MAEPAPRKKARSFKKLSVAKTALQKWGGGMMIANTIILMTEKIASYVAELVTKNASILGSSCMQIFL
jgi:hypothetical protein